MSILDVFSSMSAVQSKSDDEVRNRSVDSVILDPRDDCNFCRTRLVGLAVLNGVSSSEALFNCRNHFKDQITAIITALMVTIFQVDIPELEHV